MTTKIDPDMPNAEYHSHPAVGSSGLKLIQQSPAHYFAAYLDPNREPRESTPAQKIGTAWHASIFEPAMFGQKYIQIPDGLDKRTKEGKALWAEIEASGREALTGEGWQQIERMTAAAHAHPVSKVLFNGQPGRAEVSMFWTDPDTGVACKIRPDYAIEPCAMFPYGLICDGKTTEDASPAEFAKSAWNWEMHIQAAFYSDGFQTIYQTKEPPPFIWLAQEKSAPYCTAYYSAAADLVAYGRKLYRPLLQRLAECQRTSRWPGYSTEVAPLELPAWAAKSVSEAIAA